MAGAGAAAAAAIAQAIKASGVIIEFEPPEFQRLLHRIERPLVVWALSGAFRKYHQYLTSYRGLALFTKSQSQLSLPGSAELIAAKKIWVP